MGKIYLLNDIFYTLCLKKASIKCMGKSLRNSRIFLDESIYLLYSPLLKKNSFLGYLEESYAALKISKRACLNYVFKSIILKL